ncbi:unnamed protein product [Fraxinus pennsylvanica]|uniref:UNC93-like protein 3 n=1 Tax=Fraxinus pennsylvanica TaxID=56036 RepID=A0AAD2E911_9LAMI|nr:unnamed protein product [Fraxinus pennsylvanica]
MDEETALVVESSSPTNTLNHKRDVHILCWAFLLIFLAYNAVQNLESTINTEGSLGTISLGISYVSFAVFSVVASLVVRKLGTKNALILGSTGFWLFIAANLMPTWYIMVPASLFLGFATSMIWVGQGTYLTSTAHSHADDYDLHEGTVIGMFNGEFYGMYACNQLVGNLITLALLRDGKGGKTTGTTLLFVMFLCSSTVGSILIILLVIPLQAYSGLQQAFVWAEYTKHLIKPTLGERGVGGAMAVYGVFDIICSVAAGRLTSGLLSITIIVSLGAFIEAIVLCLLLLNYSISGGLLSTLYLLLIGGMWGIGNGVLNTQLSAFLGILFKHDLEGAFAQLNLCQSISIAVVYFLSPNISLQTMVVIMLTALCISVVGFLFLTLKIEKVFSRHAS